MANTLKQTVTQEATSFSLERLIVQYNDGEKDTQQVVNYEDLTTEEKATFDAYQALCESKMV